MATNLKLGDRLAIVGDGLAKGLTPQEAIASYKINKDGGYNAWKNQFKQTTGIDPNLDNTYDYEQFFKENPEAAKQLLTGQVSPEILKMYKTPETIQKELSIQRQLQRGSINDLMDYSKYEKLINGYMNQSVSNPVYAYGGKINMYANGTEDLDTEDTNTLTSTTDYNSEWVTNNFPSYIDVTPEELNEFKRYLIEENPFRSNDLTVPEEYRELPRTMFVSLPHNFLKEKLPYELKGYNSDRSTTYYILELIDDLIEDTKSSRESENIEKNIKNKFYRLHKLRESTPEGIAYSYWKNQLDMLKQLEEEGSTTLPNIVVYPGKYEDNIFKTLPIGDRKPIEPFADYMISHNDDPFKSLEGDVPTEVANKQRIFIPNVPEYQFELYKSEPYPLEPWDIKELLPLEKVPVPNWEIQQIKDDYQKDNSALLAFLAGLLNKTNTNNVIDDLMARLMLSKNYFADPYAGSHYTDMQPVTDSFNNNPYGLILTESNGIPLYADGGNVNIFDGTNRSKVQTADKFGLVRNIKGEPLLTIDNYIFVDRDTFLNTYPEFRNRYSYVPLSEFVLIKDGNGYRPVRRTGSESTELDRIYKEMYTDKGVYPALTLWRQKNQQKQDQYFENNKEELYNLAVLNNTVFPTDTPENLQRIQNITEPIIDSLWRLGIGHEIDVKLADENVRRALSFNVADWAKENTRKKLYLNLHPYSYNSPVVRGARSIVFDKHDRVDPYNDPRDNVWGAYLKIPEEERYSKNNPTKPNYLGLSEYSPSISSNLNSLYYDFPKDGRLRYRNRFAYGDVNWDKSIIDNILGKPMETSMVVSPDSIVTSPSIIAKDYTLSKGFDNNKGSYISYYDKWDLEPFSKGSGGNDMVGPMIGAKPIELYSREYLDDLFLNNAHTKNVNPNAVMGTYWLPQTTVNAKANGGPLNIYRGGTNNLKLSDSTRRLLLSLPSDPRSLLRIKIPVAQSDVTGRINIDKKQEQARRTNTKKVIGAAARRRAALDSYRYGDNNIGYRYRQAQAEKDPEGYMEQANAIDEARALELHTFINQETRTPLQIAVNHEKFLKNAEHEKRAEEKARADEHLGAFMNLFKILSPSYQLGAARGVYEGNNYIDALYGDLNAGLPTFLLGQYSGKGFEEQYPLTTFGINFATDWAATKGIGAIPNAASKASNVSKLANISKASKTSNMSKLAWEKQPKIRIPLGKDTYLTSSIPYSRSAYFRLGDGIINAIKKSGVVDASGGQGFPVPFFSEGIPWYSWRGGKALETIANFNNKGNYTWLPISYTGLPLGDAFISEEIASKLTRGLNKGKWKPNREVTPLVNGEANMASASDFVSYKPINIFGKNFGYIERPLGQSKPTFNISSIQDAFRKMWNTRKKLNNGEK